MRNKDTILLENAYQQVVNENINNVKPFTPHNWQDEFYIEDNFHISLKVNSPHAVAALRLTNSKLIPTDGIIKFDYTIKSERNEYYFDHWVEIEDCETDVTQITEENNGKREIVYDEESKINVYNLTPEDINQIEEQASEYFKDNATELLGERWIERTLKEEY